MCALDYPGQKISYVTEQEHTRCVRMHYPWTKDILCNRTRAYKMRAHALPRTKDILLPKIFGNTRCVRRHYPGQKVVRSAPWIISPKSGNSMVFNTYILLVSHYVIFLD